MSTTSSAPPSRARRLWGWVRRYGPAEVVGTVTALAAALAVAATDAPPAAVALAASLGETAGFYGTFVLCRFLEADLPGPAGRRLAVVGAVTVAEFGVAEAADTLVLRPTAVLLGTVLVGDVMWGVLLGKLAADVAFYALAVAGHVAFARRLLHRLRRPEATDGPAHVPSPRPATVVDLRADGRALTARGGAATLSRSA